MDPLEKQRAQPLEYAQFVFVTIRQTWPVKMKSVFGGAVLDEGLWAEVKVGGEHLRLFSEHNAQGVQASVYNVRTKEWIAPSEAVDDIEDGKERAAAVCAGISQSGQFGIATTAVEEGPLAVAPFAVAMFPECSRERGLTFHLSDGHASPPAGEVRSSTQELHV